MTGHRGTRGRPDSDDETLPEAFWSVARQLRDISQETLAPWDINPSQLRALRVLARRGVMRLSELSDRLHIAARSATEVIDALQARGLVERRPDPDDRRAKRLFLTSAARPLLKQLGTSGENTMASAPEGVASEDVEQMVFQLEIVRENLRRLIHNRNARTATGERHYG